MEIVPWRSRWPSHEKGGRTEVKGHALTSSWRLGLKARLVSQRQDFGVNYYSRALAPPCRGSPMQHAQRARQQFLGADSPASTARLGSCPCCSHASPALFRSEPYDLQKETPTSVRLHRGHRHVGRADPEELRRAARASRHGCARAYLRFIASCGGDQGSIAGSSCGASQIGRRGACKNTVLIEKEGRGGGAFRCEKRTRAAKVGL